MKRKRERFAFGIASGELNFVSQKAGNVHDVRHKLVGLFKNVCVNFLENVIKILIAVGENQNKSAVNKTGACRLGAFQFSFERKFINYVFQIFNCQLGHKYTPYIFNVYIRIIPFLISIVNI